MFFPEGTLHQFLASYGPFGLAAVVGLESMGLPLPGETALIFAAIYAGSHDHNIWIVIGAAAIGAIIGDNLGYLVGREFGFKLLRRLGAKVGLSDARIKLGQYLFIRHGGKVVFFGRFVAVLRVLAAFLAGVNQMPWRTFMLANAAGAILWASLFGWAAFTFGKSIESVKGPLGVAGLAVAVLAFIAGGWFLKQHEETLQAEAERALPGPLRQIRRPIKT